MNYYYQMLKEERICKLKVITNNSDEILHTLNEIEKIEGIENVLPFYDELIEIILMGECVDSEKVKTYYRLYNTTFAFSQIKLSNAMRCLGNNMKCSLEDLLPWHYKLWYRIKEFCNKIIK